ELQEKEFARRGGTLEMVQLWVNLPKVHKMSKPGYQTLLNRKIPVVDLGAGSVARVIAGELSGVKGSASTFTPVQLLDVRLKKGTRTELPLPAGQNAALFLLKGDVLVNSTEALAGESKLALLDPKGESVTLEARADSTLLVLGGEPIREPVASHGPFVMNTREELMQAVEDYRAGRMGHLA
ncbi:MAG: pirin family protein, partial [Bryobacteraceae bacterium]